MKRKKTIFIVTSILAFAILYRVLHSVFIYPVFIRDECYYHNHPAPFIVDLLFDFPDFEGNHPVPARWGYVFFGALGGFLGWLLGKKIFKEKSTNEVLDN